jgi:hypothetical protein
MARPDKTRIEFLNLINTPSICGPNGRRGKNAMDFRFRKILPYSAIALSFIAPVSLAIAQNNGSIAGVYVCQYGCRVTDAYPSVEINGNDATCISELGGIYHGRRLTSRSISCFNKIGALSADGKTILWDNGVVWKRVPGAPRN